MHVSVYDATLEASGAPYTFTWTSLICVLRKTTQLSMTTHRKCSQNLVAMITTQRVTITYLVKSQLHSRKGYHLPDPFAQLDLASPLATLPHLAQAPGCHVSVFETPDTLPCSCRFSHCLASHLHSYSHSHSPLSTPTHTPHSYSHSPPNSYSPPPLLFTLLLTLPVPFFYPENSG